MSQIVASGFSRRNGADSNSAGICGTLVRTSCSTWTSVPQLGSAISGREGLVVVRRRQTGPSGEWTDWVFLWSP